MPAVLEISASPKTNALYAASPSLDDRLDQPQEPSPVEMQSGRIISWPSRNRQTQAKAAQPQFLEPDILEISAASQVSDHANLGLGDRQQLVRITQVILMMFPGIRKQDNWFQETGHPGHSRAVPRTAKNALYAELPGYLARLVDGGEKEGQRNIQETLPRMVCREE